MNSLALAYDVAMLMTLGYAFLSGGPAERRGAVINVTASVLTWIVAPAFQAGFRAPELGIWIVDVLAAVAFFAIAVTSRSYWPIWAFAFSVAGASSTAARLAVGPVPFFTYFLSESAWPWAIMLVICLGIAARTRPWMAIPV